MLIRLIAIAAVVVLVVLLASAVLLSEPMSSASVVAVGVAALVGGLALSRDGSRGARRTGVILAVLGAVALAIGAGLFVLLSLGAARGY